MSEVSFRGIETVIRDAMHAFLDSLMVMKPALPA